MRLLLRLRWRFVRCFWVWVLGMVGRLVEFESDTSHLPPIVYAPTVTKPFSLHLPQAQATPRDTQSTQGPEALLGRRGNRNVKGSRRRRKQTSKTAAPRLKTHHV